MRGSRPTRGCCTIKKGEETWRHVFGFWIPYWSAVLIKLGGSVQKLAEKLGTGELFLTVLFNDAVSREGYIASKIYEWMNVEHWRCDTDRANWSTWRQIVSIPLCPRKAPLGLVWVWTRTSAVRGRRIIGWAVARTWVKETIRVT
jgi:hypothetical protein